ncbi:MAG TPA: hypothetical protein VJT71_10780 [Pyrinomonadaceae bacterium]|nr:hypothetical protein [Pyrinomonadaceae bacterium]
MSISDNNYNQARDILINAGSATANKSHPKHTGGKGSPDDHGKGLLQEARDEFRGMDKGKKPLKSDMTQAHWQAIKDAAGKMGLQQW